MHKNNTSTGSIANFFFHLSHWAVCDKLKKPDREYYT